MKGLNSRQIDCVLELAKTLNFNRAAENLFLSQPTLTYHIRSIEEEIGFDIFRRSGRGAVLTPAGRQFCTALFNLRTELKRAIEQGQNFSSRYQSCLTIGLPMRSAIHFLPQAIRLFETKNPGVMITPEFIALGSCEKFLRGEQDILFAREQDMSSVPDIKLHHLFDSRIYLIAERNDPLASKKLIGVDDLKGRVLMVGGGSQPELRAVQKRVIDRLNLEHFNSNDRETTLTNVAARKGICLAPGFLNDRNGEFAWIPFDCEEKISCVLCTHAGDRRPNVAEFVSIVKNFYAANPNFEA